MKVCLLAGRNTIHTVRWANGLAERGLEVHIATLHDGQEPLDARVIVHHLPFGAPWGYYLATPAMRRLLKEIRPHILNAHYASGYGTLARLSGFHPLLLSVWGSDVYDFPESGAFARALLIKNLKAADAIGSTSHAMARQTEKYWQPGQMFITPFGVDHHLFRPSSEPESDETVTIGTVKTLAPKYGIDTLIEAFSLLRARLVKEEPTIADKIRLLVVGDGPQGAVLRQQVNNLGLSSVTTFAGKVPHSEVPVWLGRLDIYVALSRSESFGVAVLEASACELPVVVSDADGPKEVVEHGRTGLVVPRNDPIAAAEALYALVMDRDKRRSMGKAGREHVLASYTWERSLDIMIEAYKEVVWNVSHKNVGKG